MALRAACAACFTSDLELARSQVIQAQARCNDLEELVRLVPLLTYLGAYDDCEHLLHERGLLDHAWGRQALFRVWRHRGEPNPWRALIPQQLWPQWSAELRQWLSSPLAPVRVELVGGLGDALENLALIEASTSSTPLAAGLSYAPDPSAPAALQALLPLLAPWFGKGEVGRTFTTPALRCGLCLQGWQRPPAELWPVSPYPRPRQWLVCWRCKPDLRNPLSSYSRSIDWDSLRLFLLNLQPRLAASGARLLDLTAYRPAEQRWLAAHVPSLQPVSDKIRSLADTVALLRRCQGAITVDTSLVHLAALSAEPTTLLLPLFADERWQELLQPGSAYQQWVTPLRQQQFHSWSDPLQHLLHLFEDLV